uniref:hypothetical protein n=1 Tax=Hypnea nidifica TaxID=673448 RepID=UPI0027D9E202|nr:hypothetical protein REP52_pgp124 [Hypnea nidifica]WCH54313.1 hypothetical protein [Hypnea nidifica]
MTEIILSPSVSWKLLPWIKISQKIFILQEKIYKFSKQCNQHKVHQLQDYIINSSDVKIFIIQKIINNLNNCCYQCNKKRYRVKDIEKFYIYKNLSTIQEYKKSINIVLEYIKQYLVYICIKPEWEAKFEPIYKFKLNIILNNFHSICNVNSYICIYINKHSKYLSISYFNKRIQSLQSIKCYLNYWLNYQIIERYQKTKNRYYNFYPSIFNCLKILIDYIKFNGIEWYLMYYSSFFEKNN